MSTHGIYHAIFSERQNPDRIVEKLASEGYLTQRYLDHEMDHQTAVVRRVDQRAVDDYPQFLDNGPFGQMGGNYGGVGEGDFAHLSSDGLKAFEESMAQIPVYSWNPWPGEGEPYHKPHLALSVRTLDDNFDSKWFSAVHEAAQETRSLKSFDECVAGAVYEANPEKISGEALTAAAVYFGAALYFYSYTGARREVLNWNGNLTNWDPTLARSRSDFRSRAIDTARWKFHNLHAALGAHNGRSYLENNPFKLSAIDIRPTGVSAEFSPRFIRNFSGDVLSCLKESFYEWVDALDGADMKLRWSKHDRELLTGALNEAFLTLPPEERAVVRQWHRDFGDNKQLWNGAWSPPVATSEAAQT
ncbi:hypothetical protein AB0911_38700, partial [Streptomyces nigra]|uniref:hypothetical protein n=1 Tax=Streptomyces nigra TaxID=1827580 RepID=UPI0034566DE3